MFDDLFEGSRHNRDRGHYGQDRHGGRYEHEGNGNGGYGHYNPLLSIAKKILRNKMLLAAVVLTILVIGVIGVWIIITMLPYLGQGLALAEKQGIKGILEMMPPFLQKIWEGAGK